MTDNTPPEWFLLDAKDVVVVSHGSKTLTGLSARRQMGRAERDYLLPLVRDLAGSDTGDDERDYEVADKEGTHWRIYARRIRGPHSKMCLAVQGICHRTTQPPLSRPLVGAWEWKISSKGAITRSYWSEELYDLYGYKRQPGVAPEHAQPSIWFSEIIDPRDRPAMKLSITRGAAENVPTLQTLAYRVRPRIHEGDETSVAFQLAGRAFHTAAQGTWLRGVSYAAVESNLVQKTTWKGSVPVEELSNLYMRLLPDSALAAVSTDDWNLFDVSTGWESNGLSKGGDGDLTHLVHPDDSKTVLSFLAHASESKNLVYLEHPVRVLMSDGSWRECTLSATGVTIDGGFGSYLGLHLNLL